MSRPKLPFEPEKIMLRLDREELNYLRARFGNGTKRDTTVTDIFRMLLSAYVRQCRERDLGRKLEEPETNSMALEGLDT